MSPLVWLVWSVDRHTTQRGLHLQVLLLVVKRSFYDPFFFGAKLIHIYDFFRPFDFTLKAIKHRITSCIVHHLNLYIPLIYQNQ